MRKVGVVLVVASLAALGAGAASASTPAANGVVLFQQPRCPSWASPRCSLAPQVCAVDPVTRRSFAADLPLDARFSPDGSRIAWTSTKAGATQLVVSNPDGGDAHDVAPAAPGSALPTWSPDGAHIAFLGATLANPAPLDVVDLASGLIKRIANGGFEQSWSPDGSEIATSALNATDNPVIVEVDPTDGSTRAVTSEAGTPDQPADFQPDWSPDSARIAFTHTAFGQPAQVETVARDGSARRVLTEGANPAWSPGGAQIAFLRTTASAGGNELWTAEVDGSGERPLWTDAPVFNADVRWLTARQTAAVTAIGSCDTELDQSGARVEGGDGVDTFFVDAPNEVVQGNGGDDAFWVGPTAVGAQHVDGGAGADFVEVDAAASLTVGAGAGNDFVDALRDQRAERVAGGSGNDWIRTGDGNDTIGGGPGNDRLFGFFGANTIHGGAGNDVVSAYSGSAPQRLFGDAGNDRLLGGHGPDRLYGGPGRDTILGHGGNDVVVARDGFRDTIDCGAGRDTAYVDRLDVVRHCERVFRSRY